LIAWGFSPSRNERLRFDLTVFGAVPLEIYAQTKELTYLDLGRKLADEQWVHPIEDGLANQTRFWINDMYIVTLVEVQAYRAWPGADFVERVSALAMILIKISEWLLFR
jgi:unsaturated rhamnogalacturonyl hydrolase